MFSVEVHMGRPYEAWGEGVGAESAAVIQSVKWKYLTALTLTSIKEPSET